jgi:hypothetical protein
VPDLSCCYRKAIPHSLSRRRSFQGSYLGTKKAGFGSYHFLNSDVYEGEFASDRMDGLGVYSFQHEGRWDEGRGGACVGFVNMPR